MLGTCNGGLCSAEAEYAWKHGRSSRPFDERMNLQAQLYGFGKAMASALKLGGEAWLVTTACSSTTVALGLAQLGAPRLGVAPEDAAYALLRRKAAIVR